MTEVPSAPSEKSSVDRAHFEGCDGTALSAWQIQDAPGAPASGSGPRPVVLMVHGNGLNGRCWLPVAEQLASHHWRCFALDLRGHGSSGRSPGDNYDWGLFAADVALVVAELGRRYPGAPVVGVGHSAGASALIIAGAGQGAALCCLWAYEPIMTVPGSDLRQARSPELAARARRRRERFASADEALEHFWGRGAFAEFSRDALEAYVEGGLVRAPEGDFVLACRPEDEALVYEAAPAHDAWDVLGQLRSPLRLAGGANSPAVPPPDLEAIATRAGATRPWVVDGLGHFGPFADAALIAADIEDFARHAGCAGRAPDAGYSGGAPDAGRAMEPTSAMAVTGPA
ncbi:MAG TPA: alpha/beta fold hydrolase [Acidimicrobiales bacterium]|nr:alpha/beta fold hydrolase [Acidimicrobiales bacterium]